MDICLLIVLAIVVIFLFYGSTETVIREGLASSGNPWKPPSSSYIIAAIEKGDTDVAKALAPICKAPTVAAGAKFSAPFCTGGGQSSGCIWPGPGVPLWQNPDTTNSTWVCQAGCDQYGHFPAGQKVTGNKQCGCGDFGGARGRSITVESVGADGTGKATCSLGSPDGLYQYINGYDSYNNTHGVSPPSPWQKGSPFWLRTDNSGNSWTISLGGGQGNGPWYLTAYDSKKVMQGKWQSPSSMINGKFGEMKIGQIWAWGGQCTDTYPRGTPQALNSKCKGHFDYEPDHGLCFGSDGVSMSTGSDEIDGGICYRWLPVGGSATGVLKTHLCAIGTTWHGQKIYCSLGLGTDGTITPGPHISLPPPYCATSGITCDAGQHLLIENPPSTLCSDFVPQAYGPSVCPSSAGNKATCCTSAPVCKCPNGVPATGAACTKATPCSSCNSGYQLVGGNCTPYLVCKCPNGAPATGAACTKASPCAHGSCNSGYQFTMVWDGAGTCTPAPGTGPSPPGPSPPGPSPPGPSPPPVGSSSPPPPGASNNGDGKTSGQNKITPAPFMGTFIIGNLNCHCDSTDCNCTVDS